MTEGLRVAHLLVTGGWGGAEVLACGLAKRAKLSGYEVQLDAAPRAQAGVVAQGFVATGRESRLLHWALAAHRRLDRFVPDVVHVHLSTPALTGAALIATRGFPVIATLHLLPEGRWPNDFLLPISCAHTLRLATCQPFGMRLVAVSRHDAAELERHLGTQSITSVLNAPIVDETATIGSHTNACGATTLRLLVVARLEVQRELIDCLTHSDNMNSIASTIR